MIYLSNFLVRMIMRSYERHFLKLILGPALLDGIAEITVSFGKDSNRNF
jgi:hypothetical protein